MSLLSEVRNLLLPFIWVEETGVASEEDVEQLKEDILRPEKSLKAVGWTMVAAGAAVSAFAMLALACDVRREARKRRYDE